MWTVCLLRDLQNVQVGFQSSGIITSGDVNIAQLICGNRDQRTVSTQSALSDRYGFLVIFFRRVVVFLELFQKTQIMEVASKVERIGAQTILEVFPCPQQKLPGF